MVIHIEGNETKHGDIETDVPAGIYTGEGILRKSQTYFRAAEMK